MFNRAHALLVIKQANDEQRLIRGVASTPTVDRVGDIVEPLGLKFTNPMPLLHHHRSDQPVGIVELDNPTKDGIEFQAHLPKIEEPGPLRDRVNTAWGEIKNGLIRGVSIGFRPIEGASEKLKSGGIRFKESEILELSLVAVPANHEASIHTIRSFDTAQRAASGQSTPSSVVRLSPPGVSGQSQPNPQQEGKIMKTIGEQLTALESKRAASAARMETIMQKTLDEDRTSDTSEQEEFDTLSSEVEAIDRDLVRLRKIEKTKALSAAPIGKATTPQEGAAARANSIVVRQPELPPGIEGARALKVQMVAKMDGKNLGDVAAQMYGADSNVFAAVTKTAVPAGTTISPNWASGLIGVEAGPVADFVAYLRPRTILGRFGLGNIPSLRMVSFYSPLITQTAPGEGYWVGEGKAKPLTSFNFTRTHLAPLKVANITVLTMENIRYSDPKSDTIVRDQLAQALIHRLDVDFITPAKAAVTNVSPASVTNGAPSIASSGTDIASIQLDLRSLWAKFTAANNPPSTGVLVMSSNTTVALASMLNPLGQPAFPGVDMTGGTLFGMPVISSDNAGNIVVLINAQDVYLGDDGGITVEASEEASLEMADSTSGDSGAPTAVSLVSMFQTNSVAIRAERIINWMRRRTQSVAYLTGVSWGGPVHTA